MYSTLFSAALFASLALKGALAADALTIDTPTITQCSDVRITWSGGKSSYNLIVVDAANPCDSVVADLGDHDGTSMTWKSVPLKAGTQVQLSLEDANEDEAWTGTITVGKSDDSSCLSGSSASGSGTLSATSTASQSGSTLTVSPTGAVGGVEASPSSSASASVGPVGAAGAGIGQSSGAASIRASITLLGAAIAAAAFVL